MEKLYIKIKKEPGPRGFQQHERAEFEGGILSFGRNYYQLLHQTLTDLQMNEA